MDTGFPVLLSSRFFTYSLEQILDIKEKILEEVEDFLKYFLTKKTL